jgi:hypothetical protein
VKQTTKIGTVENPNNGDPASLGSLSSRHGPFRREAISPGIEPGTLQDANPVDGLVAARPKMRQDEGLVRSFDQKTPTGLQRPQNLPAERQVVRVREVAEAAEPVEGGIEFAAEVNTAHVGMNETHVESLPGRFFLSSLQKRSGQVNAGHPETALRKRQRQPTDAARYIENLLPFARPQHPPHRADLLARARIVERAFQDAPVQTVKERLKPFRHDAASAKVFSL